MAAWRSAGTVIGLCVAGQEADHAERRVEGAAKSTTV